jgi:hypothetical protein
MAPRHHHHGSRVVDHGWDAASLEGIEPADVEFAEGHQLDDKTAELVPAVQIGWMLSPKQAAMLLDRIERDQRPKK